MTDFLVQLQLERAGDLDLDAVARRAEEFAKASSFVTRFTIQDGEDYRNLVFATATPKLFWAAFATAFLGHEINAQTLKQCCIATCEGKRSWDDYLLLHHYDEAQLLDRIA